MTDQLIDHTGQNQPSTPAVPDLAADWACYYGIRLADVGENGDVVVLGHHDDPRRVLAALHRHAREFWGDRHGLCCDDVQDALGNLMQRWARFLTSCEDPATHRKRVESGQGCEPCEEIAAGRWWITWAVKSTDPGAFPITHWSS